MSKTKTPGIPNIFKLMIGFNGVSIFGNVISDIAIPWFILEITNNPLYVSIVMAFKVLPLLTSSLIGGIFIDKFGYIKVSVYSDFVNFFAILLIPVLFTLDLMNIGVMLIMVFLSTFLDAPGRTAKEVMIAREITARNSENEKINGFDGVVENICDLVAPAVSGILISSLGAIYVFYIDSATFLIPLFGVLLMMPYLKGKKVTQDKKSTDIIKGVDDNIQLKFAIKYILKKKSLLSLMIISMLVNAIISPLVAVYLPVFIKNSIGSATSLGIVLLFFGLGTTLSSGLYAFFGQRADYKKMLKMSYTFLGGLMLLLPYLGSVFSLSVTLFLIGLSIGFCGPLGATFLQKNVENKLQGRVFSIYNSIRFLPVPIGMVLFGFLLENHLTSYIGYFMCGIIWIGVFIFTLMNRIRLLYIHN